MYDIISTYVDRYIDRYPYRPGTPMGTPLHTRFPSVARNNRRGDAMLDDALPPSLRAASLTESPF
eukprot:SAG31_NODE_443_length_15645_cov_51.693169_1_plen_65_part_00